MITHPMIDIVIPVYNEKENIVKTLVMIQENVNPKHRILIVYDFDEDSTLPAVKAYWETHNTSHIHLVKNTFGRGALNAIKTGFAASRSTATLVVMADMSDDLAICNQMYEKIARGADVVCGSRYMRGGKQLGGPWLKSLLSRMAGVSLHFLTGLPTHDVTNSFKMYRTSMLQSLEIESRGGFEIGMEIVVKAFIQGYQVTEVPSIWQDRSEGASRFQLFKWLPGYLKWYFLACRKSVLTPFGLRLRVKKP